MEWNWKRIIGGMLGFLLVLLLLPRQASAAPSEKRYAGKTDMTVVWEVPRAERTSVYTH